MVDALCSQGCQEDYVKSIQCGALDGLGGPQHRGLLTVQEKGSNYFSVQITGHD